MVPKRLTVAFILSNIFVTSQQSQNKFLYFAYGSNLLTQRIHINNPSAIRIGIAKLQDYRIDFVSYSKKWGGAPATIIPKNHSHVWGALWQIDQIHLDSLDKQEGVHINLYRPLTVKVETLQGEHVECRTYQQTANFNVTENIEDIPDDRRPSIVYLKTILKGAEESNLPEDYQQFLHRIPHNDYKGETEFLLNL